MLGRGPIAFGPLAALGAYQAAGGIVGVTLGPVTLVGTGKVLGQADLAVTLAPLTLAAAGSIPHTATASITLGALTLAGTADLIARGTASITLGTLTIAASGDAIAGGDLATTLGALTLAGTAKALIQGQLGGDPQEMDKWTPISVQVPLADSRYSLAPLVLAGGGTVENYVFQGAFAATLGPLTLAGVADLIAKGTLSTSLGPLTLAGEGTTPVAGALDATLASLTLTGTAKALIQGYLGSNPGEMDKWNPLASQAPLADPKYGLDPLELAAAGNLSVKGTLAATLGLSLAAVGTLPIKGTLAATLGLSLAGTGKVLARATLASTAGPLALVGTGSVPAYGTLATTLGPLALASTGKVAVAGTLGTTLAQLTLAGDGTVENFVFSGDLNATLGPLTLAAQAKALIRGHLGGPVMALWTPLAIIEPLAGAYDLQPLTLAGAGQIRDPSFAGLAVTLGPLTLASTGKVRIEGQLTGGPVKIAAWVPLASAVPLAVTAPIPYTLASINLIMSGVVLSGAHLGDTLFPLVLVGTGTAKNQVFSGAMVAGLGPLALGASGQVSDPPGRVGILTATLGPVRLEAQGRILAGVPTWPHEWCPTPGPTRTTTVLVSTASFGDGYTWRTTRGLNPMTVALEYSFPFVGMAELAQMESFLTTYGSAGFKFVPPDLATPIQVCCVEWTATIIEKGRDGVVGKLNATFQQAYNPQSTQLLAA